MNRRTVLSASVATVVGLAFLSCDAIAEQKSLSDQLDAGPAAVRVFLWSEAV